MVNVPLDKFTYVSDKLLFIVDRGMPILECNVEFKGNAQNH